MNRILVLLIVLLMYGSQLSAQDRKFDTVFLTNQYNEFFRKYPSIEAISYPPYGDLNTIILTNQTGEDRYYKMTFEGDRYFFDKHYSRIDPPTDIIEFLAKRFYPSSCTREFRIRPNTVRARLTYCYPELSALHAPPVKPVKKIKAAKPIKPTKSIKTANPVRSTKLKKNVQPITAAEADQSDESAIVAPPVEDRDSGPIFTKVLPGPFYPKGRRSLERALQERLQNVPIKDSALLFDAIVSREGIFGQLTLLEGNDPEAIRVIKETLLGSGQWEPQNQSGYSVKSYLKIFVQRYDRGTLRLLIDGLSEY